MTLSLNITVKIEVPNSSLEDHGFTSTDWVRCAEDYIKEAVQTMAYGMQPPSEEEPGHPFWGIRDWKVSVFNTRKKSDEN